MAVAYSVGPDPTLRPAMPAVPCAAPRSSIDHRREPERTLLYRTVQTHLATWLALQDDGTGETAPAATEREFRRYLACGILAHGFARARCADCGHDFLIALPLPPRIRGSRHPPR